MYLTSSWIPALGTSLSQPPYNLLDTRTYSYPTPSHQLPAVAATFLLAARTALPVGLDEQEARQFLEDTDRAWEECVRMKGHISYDHQLVVARKPTISGGGL